MVVGQCDPVLRQIFKHFILNLFQISSWQLKGHQPLPYEFHVIILFSIFMHIARIEKKYVASFTDWFYSSPHVSTHQWQVWSINLIPLTDYFKQREKLIHMHLYKSFNISIFHIFNLYKDIYLVSTIKNNELIYLLILELGIY